MKNISKLLAPVVVIALLMPAFTLGATPKADDEVSIKKGFLQDNLYVAGGNVSVNSKIDGDLITVGGNVLISEDVSKDITVAGGSMASTGEWTTLETGKFLRNVLYAEHKTPLLKFVVL